VTDHKNPTTPGAPDDDELSIRAILRLRGVNYGDAAPHPDPIGTAAAAAVATMHPHPVPASSAQPDADADAQPSAGDWWDALYAAAATDTHDTDAQSSAQPGADAQPSATEEPVEKTDADAQPDRTRTPWWARRTPVPAPVDDDADEDDDPTVPIDDDEDDAGDEGSADAQPRRTPSAHPKRTRIRAGGRKGGGNRNRGRGPASGPNVAAYAPAPRMSLLDAVANVPPRIRWLILHGSAAGVGYALGWVRYSTRTAAWIADHGLLTVSGIFWCGCAIGAEALRNRFSTYRLPVRLLAAVPIASIVLGSLLYGTGWQNLELPL